jgi:CheY-like chemotaxis protein
VLLVALAADGQERRSSEAGFDAHLVKPVSYDDLTRLLGRPGPSDA